MGYHKDETGSSLHTPFRWVFFNSDERDTASVGASDVNKVAFEQLTNSMYVLTDDSPVTWVKLGPYTHPDDITLEDITADTITVPEVICNRLRPSTSGTTGLYFGYCTLTDDEVINMRSAFPAYPLTTLTSGYIKMIIDGEGLGEVGFDVTMGAPVMVSDIFNNFAVSDTDGKVCIYRDTYTLKLKNRVGSTISIGLCGYIF